MIKESEIVAGCLKKEKHFQELLFKKYSSKMYGVCLRYFKNKDEAKDCLQEGFIKVYSNLESFKGDGSFEGWIRRIMVNTALNKIKSNLRFNLVTEIDEGELRDIKDENIFAELDNELNGEELLKIINGLPDGYKTIFNLYAVEGYSHKEISEKLGISEGTSKSQLSRARTLLQQKIELIKTVYER